MWLYFQSIQSTNKLLTFCGQNQLRTDLKYLNENPPISLWCHPPSLKSWGSVNAAHREAPCHMNYSLPFCTIFVFHRIHFHFLLFLCEFLGTFFILSSSITTLPHNFFSTHLKTEDILQFSLPEHIYSGEFWLAPISLFRRTAVPLKFPLNPFLHLFSPFMDIISLFLWKLPPTSEMHSLETFCKMVKFLKPCMSIKNALFLPSHLIEKKKTKL